MRLERLDATARANRPSQPEEIARLDVEAVARALQPVESQRPRFGEETAVAREEDGARRRLVGEERVDSKAVALERGRRKKEAGCRIADDDGQVGPRIVAQRVLRAAGVLADESQKDRPRHLVLDFQPRNASHADGGSVGAAVVRLHLILWT